MLAFITIGLLVVVQLTFPLNAALAADIFVMRMI